MKQIIHADNAPAAIGPYNHAVSANGLVFVSGQLGIDPKTGELCAGIEAQAAQAFKNLKAILDATGSSMDRLVKTTVFLKDIADFARVNEIYASYISVDFPARSAIQVAALPKGALIEIEAVAVQ